MFEFDLANPSSWHNFNAPPMNPRVPVELLTIGGMNAKGQPRLRAIWGGKEQIHYEGDEVNPEGWYLKYHLCFTPPELRGFEYKDFITGQTKRVSTRIALPEHVPVIPLYHQEEIGKPRWIIEMWRDVGDCNGFYVQEGYYHLLTVQKEPIDNFTGMGPYREIDEDVLQMLRGMVHFMLNTTEAQREAFRAADELKAKEEKQKAKEADWEDYGESLERFEKDRLYERNL